MNGFGMGFGEVGMILIVVLSVVAIAALVKYLTK